MAVGREGGGKPNALFPLNGKRQRLDDEIACGKTGRLPKPYEPLYTRGPGDGQLGELAQVLAGLGLEPVAEGGELGQG